MSRISPKQITLIHVAKAQLGLSDEEYRELLVSRYPQAFAGSCKELSYEQASDLIDHFKGRGFEIKKPARKRKPRNVTEMIHAGHPMARKIEHLEADITWRLRDGARRFSRKIIGKDRPATTREAAKLIEALKGLKASQQRKAV